MLALPGLSNSSAATGKHLEPSFPPALSPKPLTQAQPVPGELPFTAVVGQAVTLLVKGHLLWIHDNGQVSCFNICGIGLKTGRGEIIQGIHAAIPKGGSCLAAWGVPCLPGKFILSQECITAASCLSSLHSTAETQMFVWLPLVALGKRH